MKLERYTISVFDDYVTIYGDLTIEEAFDFINYFEKKGFNTVTCGEENSTLCLMKKSVDERRIEIIDECAKYSEYLYETMYKAEKEEVIRLCHKIGDLENLIREITLENEKTKNELQKARFTINKQMKLSEMSYNPIVLKILEERNLNDVEKAD